MSKSGLKNDPVRGVCPHCGRVGRGDLCEDGAKPSEEEMEALREEVRIRTDFFDTLSHDLRTPLTAIKAYTDLLLRYRDEKEEIQVQFLQVIADESERMHALINDYLDLSKMENCRCIHLRREEVDLVELIDYFLTVFNGTLVQKRIELVKSYTTDLPFVVGDKQRLGQVMTNLMGNALKFTPEGGKIRVEVKGVPGDGTVCKEEKSWVRVLIEDSGPGIPEETRDRVFEKFYQVRPAEREERQGSGLGLPIVREILQLHGGEIRVESGSLGGSAMVFLLPVFSQAGTSSVTSKPRE